MASGEGGVELRVGALLRDRAFLAKYPYYAAILARLRPVADPTVDRMAVALHAGRFYLLANEEALAREPEFTQGILLHEIHHIVLGHLSAPQLRALEDEGLRSLAMEMSANEYILEPLPSPILVEHFSACGVRPGQSTEERYALLAKAALERRRPSPRSGTGEVDEHRFLDAPPPGGAGQHARRLLSEAIEEAHEAAQQSPERRARLIAGRSPESLLLRLHGATRAPERPIDWRQALERFVAEARAPVRVHHRPNRRFPSRVFEVPGRAYRPRPIDRPHLLVAIDTSMSVSEAELVEVAAQLDALSAHARLTIVECDAALGRVYPYEGSLPTLAGRGGTDLRPPLEPALLARLGVDGVVFFTDGQGPTPETPPPRPVLFVLSKELPFDCGFGQRVWLRQRVTAVSQPS